MASGATRQLVGPGLNTLGLAGEFDTVVAREEVTRGKPDPELYLIAARRLGVEPEHCLAVDDAPDGIAAAWAAGMHVITVLAGHLAPTGPEAAASGSARGQALPAASTTRPQPGPAARTQGLGGLPAPPDDGTRPSHERREMPVLHSTKNLHVIEPPTPSREGIGVFEYTDHYTVFHYGRMPDQIPGKGEAICRMAHFNFLLLEDAGVATHFRRLLAPNRIEFTLARTPESAAAAPGPAPSGNRLLPPSGPLPQPAPRRKLRPPAPGRRRPDPGRHRP